jgi:hypothetical protein
MKDLWGKLLAVETITAAINGAVGWFEKLFFKV